MFLIWQYEKTIFIFLLIWGAKRMFWAHCAYAKHKIIHMRNMVSLLWIINVATKKEASTGIIISFSPFKNEESCFEPICSPNGLCSDKFCRVRKTNPHTKVKDAFFKKDFYLFMREREREAETQAEGEAGSMQGTRRGTRSRGSRIRPWPKAALSRWATRAAQFFSFMIVLGFIFPATTIH